MNELDILVSDSVAAEQICLSAGPAAVLSGNVNPSGLSNRAAESRKTEKNPDPSVPLPADVPLPGLGVRFRALTHYVPSTSGIFTPGGRIRVERSFLIEGQETLEMVDVRHAVLQFYDAFQIPYPREKDPPTGGNIFLPVIDHTHGIVDQNRNWSVLRYGQ